MEPRMIKKIYSWQDVESMCIDIVTQMTKQSWKPDYIVGITRGGNVPATIISNMLNVRCETLKVSLRDDSDVESNLWMSEDAFGYIPIDEQQTCRWDIHLRKKILIVDDINDTGNTLQWITQDWQTTCLPQEEAAWDSIWHNTVKFATLTDNSSSKFKVDYWGDEVHKGENDVWLVYPWETVGKIRNYG